MTLTPGMYFYYKGERYQVFSRTNSPGYILGTNCISGDVVFIPLSRLQEIDL